MAAAGERATGVAAGERLALRGRLLGSVTV